MATCPSCRAHYPEGTHACAVDGDGLLPDAAFSAADAELEAGRLVGEYRIEGKLGSGGFGTVYRAVHPLIGKTAAVKLLARQYSSNPQMVARFIAEARAVNQIRHRHIIDIFSFGSLDDGRQYFVMELLEGMTLDAFLKERKTLTPEEAIPILRAVARALDAAHARGIAHRDLKPENVFLAMQDGEIFPKLLDFGIAKLLGEAATASGLKTNTGTPIGTPHYMSPEQCRGRDIDHRTDIYSFGVMAFELLTGRLPFPGADVMEILMKQVSARPPPMSKINRELAPALDAPVLAMLEKEPERRPKSVTAAVDALANAARSAGHNIPIVPASGESGARIVPDIASARELGEAPTLGATPVSIETFQGTASERLISTRSPARRVIAIGAAATLGVVAMVGFASRSGEGAKAMPAGAAVAASAAPTAEPALASRPAAAAPASSTVAIAIDSTPPGASIKRGDETVGRTPAKMWMNKSDAKVPLTLTLDGYEIARVEIAPTEDRTMIVPLQAARPSTKKASASSSKPAPTTKPTAAGSGTADIPPNPFK